MLKVSAEYDNLVYYMLMNYEKVDRQTRTRERDNPRLAGLGERKMLNDF